MKLYDSTGGTFISHGGSDKSSCDLIVHMKARCRHWYHNYIFFLGIYISTWILYAILYIGDVSGTRGLYHFNYFGCAKVIIISFSNFAWKMIGHKMATNPNKCSRPILSN